MLVMREGVLKGAAGKTIVRVNYPVRVRLGPDIKGPIHKQDLPVRVVLPAGGYIVAIRRKKTGSANILQSLGRYVRRRTLLYHEPGRKPLGAAYPGAFLRYHTVALPTDGRWVQVLVTVFGARPHLDRGCMRTNHQHYFTDQVGNRSGTILAWVDQGDLGVQRLAVPGSDYWIHPMNHNYRLLDVPGGKPFMTLQCGPFRKIAERGGHVLLAQLRDGIEITGWVAKAKLRSRVTGSRCVSRSGAMHRRSCYKGLQRGMFLGGMGGIGRMNSSYVLSARSNHVVIGGTGTALLDKDGKKIGWLPPRTSLVVKTPKIILQRINSPFKLGRVESWFKLGPVEVFGQAEIAQAHIPNPDNRPFGSPQKQTFVLPISPAPTWASVTTPQRVGREFMARAFRKGTRLWLRTGKGPCRQLNLKKVVRKRIWTGYGNRVVWVLAIRDSYVDRDGGRCLCTQEGFFDYRAALLSFEHSGTSCYCRYQGKVGSVSSRGGIGSTIFQIVAVHKNKAVLVRGGDYSRYAQEDTMALSFDKATCEASSEPNLIF
ncbi:MAG: hypothetical protein KAI47_06775 [Deltaproteobacteria bacterium]|nr:hypothetical protein [Deltaproteobacteria bacterium]